MSEWAQINASTSPRCSFQSLHTHTRAEKPHPHPVPRHLLIAHASSYTLHIVPIVPLCQDARQMNGVGQVAGQEDWGAKDGVAMNQE